MRSEAAKLLRDEDEGDVLRLFDYRDKRDRLWDSIEDFDASEATKALSAIRTLESMINTLQKHLGIGPAARASLGVVTNRRPGSDLNAFLSGPGAAQEP